MKLPINAKKLIDLINESGYDAYAVGGFVRDSIMNRECGDIDIASSALPNELEAILDANGIKYVETGIKHGTISAIIDHVPYEITTFRVDGDYIDNRHPNDVEFVRDISSDLSRRDFTINAIAYNDRDGIVDEYDGVGDINRGIIKCVGNADSRFKEDALRIVRCLRFASVLGFDIENETKKALFDNKELLKNISVERVFVELNKLLLGDNVEKVLLEYRYVLAVVIPEFIETFDFEQNTKWHIYDVYTHTIKSLALSPKVDYIRMALLLHDIGKPATYTFDDRGGHFIGHQIESAKIAKTVLQHFKASNEYINKVVTLIENHNDYIRNNNVGVKRWLNRLGQQMTYDYIDVKIADLSTHNIELSKKEIENLNNARKRIDSIVNNNEPYRLSDLNINGNDIKNLGYSGKEIAEALNFLLDEVIKNPSINNKQILIEKIKERK